jgi:hypothetical protein
MKSNSASISSPIYSMGLSGGVSDIRAANLMWHAKHMRVILNETAHSCQASQRATCLVSMDDAKLGHSYW